MEKTWDTVELLLKYFTPIFSEDCLPNFSGNYVSKFIEEKNPNNQYQLSLDKFSYNKKEEQFCYLMGFKAKPEDFVVMARLNRNDKD